MKLLSTVEAAAKLRVSVARVQQLIWDERLPAQKIGGSYVIREDDLMLVGNRKPGRPRTESSPAKAKKPAAKKR